LALFAAACCGCEAGKPAAWFPKLSADDDAPPTPVSNAVPALAPPDASSNTASRRTTNVTLQPLLVQVPVAARDRTGPIWSHLREDVLDADAALGLDRNGIRVGVGRDRDWDQIKAALDSIEGLSVSEHRTVALRPGWPLALETDVKPRDQTIFFVDRDGIVSGETWPRSRNVLRLTCALHPRDPQRTVLTIVPEVRQELGGWRWVRTEAGIIQAPEYNGRAYAAAAFSVDLGRGEFVLIAPSERADVYGLVGGAVLSGESGQQRADSYVFLRVELKDGQ
jgi:hypothetical protein